MTVALKRPNAFLSALFAAGVVIAALIIGSLATFANLQPWYAGLSKPIFSPPNWVFGPVWSTLYVLMATAFWRILRQPVGALEKRAAVAWFLVQMALNALWSVAFFGLHSPLFGLIVISLMLVAIVITILRFARLDPLAAGLLVPYVMWVGFASVLNAAVWWLNR